MDMVLAIFRKELKGFLMSPGFYFCCFAVAVVMSWMFPSSLSMFAAQMQNSQFAPHMAQGPQANIHYGVFLRHLSQLNLLLILVVPVFTMKLFAEEKKLRTFDLLLTSPVTSAQIVIGKYLAALGAIGFICLLALLYPMSTLMFTKIDWAPLLIASLGIFLIGAVYAAMNLFCSAMTESIIVACVTSVIMNVGVWFLGVGVEVFDGPTVRKVFEHISLNQHLVAIVEGTVRTSSLIYFGSLIALFCFMSERVVESTRWR